MFELRRVLITSLSTLASATLLTACIDDERGEWEAGDDEGISIDEETGGEVPDLPDDEGEGEGEDDEEEEEKPPTCETTSAIASTVPPNVMLVLDKSRSMVNYTWDHDGSPQTTEVTRWASLHATVDSITSQYQDGMHMGLSLFPAVEADQSYGGACLVHDTPEVGVALGNAAAIMAAIPAAESMAIYGATPAAAGIATALAHLESLDDGLPAAMILVTDGAANCGLGAEGLDRFDQYDEDLPLLVADAWERAGIPTYVIGIDIEEVSEHPFTTPREKLDEVAQLGGVPQPGEVGFYDASSAEALMAALDDIAASVSRATAGSSAIPTASSIASSCATPPATRCSRSVRSRPSSCARRSPEVGSGAGLAVPAALFRGIAVGMVDGHALREPTDAGEHVDRRADAALVVGQAAQANVERIGIGASLDLAQLPPARRTRAAADEHDLHLEGLELAGGQARAQRLGDLGRDLHEDHA
jgi:hypothetical protein